MEPNIQINGHTLTNAQAMTIRVAIESFDCDLQTDGLGNDEHGVAMVKLYRARINEIRSMIFGK